MARDPATGLARADLPINLTFVREGAEPKLLAQGTTDAYGIMLARVLAEDVDLGTGQLHVDVDDEQAPLTVCVTYLAT